jgi:hypothetical protein
MKHIHIVVLGFIALSGSLCQAADFTFEVESPNVRVVVPNIPPVKLEPHPMRQARPHMRLLGTNGPFTVSVLMPTADAGMTPAECAGSTLGALPKRPGVPAQEKIFKARINERTFIALYDSQMAGETHLHAHLLSGVGGTHCVEVHVSKFPASEDDIKSWRKNWGAANIEAK